MGTKLQFSTAFHPQTEVVNRSLGNLLRYLVGENLRAWDLILPTAEFAYNSSVNRTIGMSLFEVAHGYQPRQPIDVIPMAPHYTRMFESAASFALHIHDLHKEISNQIQKNNANYKAYADLHRKAHEFNVRDYVMVRIRSEQYPPGTVKKLHARSAGPFKILKKINSNAYIVDLPSDFGISPSFNIEDLIAYKEPNFSPDNPLLDKPSYEPISERPLLPPLPQIHLTHMAEQIDEIIDDQIVSNRDGGYHRFFGSLERTT